jgi:phosphatidate cytidylyltransferase
MNDTAPKKSDLGVRTLSAVVLLAVSGTALWLGGWWWTVFVAAVALGVLWEWWGLVSHFGIGLIKRITWLIFGLAYVACAGTALVMLRDPMIGLGLLAALIGAVIATDIGAYFTGRTVGGPRIAPLISPAKTWSGLFGGMVAAAIVLVASGYRMARNGCIPQDISACGYNMSDFVGYALAGCLIAVIAQAGDFFESWMKRRAEVKDSGSLIPGHGGLFDRADGLLAVMAVMGIIGIADKLSDSW